MRWIAGVSGLAIVAKVAIQDYLLLLFRDLGACDPALGRCLAERCAHVRGCSAVQELPGGAASCSRLHEPACRCLQHMFGELFFTAAS